MIKIGITGQEGFIGTHLYNTLGLDNAYFARIPFEDVFFEKAERLKDFVSQCDVIVHLAAMNRHNDPDVIYNTNITLVKKLISACELTGSNPHILFSSSIQEESDNQYGRSKREGRRLLEEWALKNNGKFTGLIIPNVFGPFGRPYYNSVVATFCHQLTHDIQPKIDLDGNLKLIYVGDLVSEIITHIKECQIKNTLKPTVSAIHVKHNVSLKVSELLKKLEGFKETYLAQGIFPCMDNPFDRNLFNSFQCYIDLEKFYPFHLSLNTDSRGSFVEIAKINSGGQISFSTTHSGITRGNHYHTRKAERFAVIKGLAKIEMRKVGSNEKLVFELNGEDPSFVDMPVWHTHNITNIGEEDLYTIFWTNEQYKAEDPDTFFEKI